MMVMRVMLMNGGGRMKVEASPSASGHSSVAFNILSYKYKLGSAVTKKDSA